MMLLWVLLLVPTIVVGMKATAVAGPPSNGQQRSWVQIPRRIDPGSPGADPRGEAAPAGRIVRILSYNVLGARQGLSKKHAHVGLDIRNWSTRRDRLREEIWSYHKSKPGGLHVVCLEEVTFRTLGDTWLPFMAKLGLDRHVYQPKSDRPQKRHRSRCLGVAIFYASEYFEKAADLRVVFSEQARGLRENSNRKRKRPDGVSEFLEPVQPGPRRRKIVTRDQYLRRVYGGDTGTGGPEGREDPATASRLEQDLEDKHDAAAMVRLRLKRNGDSGRNGRGGDGEENELAITVVCAHLFYDPKRPDLKTAQCQMLFQAIQRFHEKIGVAVVDSASQPSSKGPANLILCADFNSKPVVDPFFLPGPLKAAAEARFPDGATPTTQDPSISTPQRSNDIFSKDIYPTSQDTASGVYSLLEYGRVPPTHPEHPDTFIPEFVKEEEEREALERARVAKSGRRRWTPQRPLRPGDPPVVRAVHHPSGEWTSGFGTSLEDVYRDRGNVSPRFTTKTSSFSGVIDHLFVSTGEKDSGLKISGVIAFPPGANLAEERGAPPPQTESRIGVNGSVGGTASSSPEEQSDKYDAKVEHEEKENDGHTQGEFLPIPNKVWGSDHLALGVEVTVA